MKTGRYGERNKVPLKITIDKRISDSLHKIKKKGSVSNMINGLLDITIRQFDPGPSSPLIYDLHALLKRHRKIAEEEEDPERIACVEILESQLQPYYELAEVKGDEIPCDIAQERELQPEIVVSQTTEILAESSHSRHDYAWYSVPRICHGAPMTYSRKERMWKCAICEVH